MKNYCEKCLREFNVVAGWDSFPFEIDFIGDTATIINDQKNSLPLKQMLHAERVFPIIKPFKVDVDNIYLDRHLFHVLFNISSRENDGILVLKDVSFEEGNYGKCILTAVKIGKGSRYDIWYNALDPYVFLHSDSCPVCNGNLVNFYDKLIDEKTIQRLNTFLETCESDNSLSIDVDQNKVDILEFIRILINTEKGILFFSEQLKNLYKHDIELSRELVKIKDECSKKIKFLSQKKSDIDDYIKIYDREPLDEIHIRSSYSLKEPKLVKKPEMPLIEKPLPPVFEKPGLFNKKKVEMHNSVLQRQYDIRVSQYETEMAKYYSQLNEYDSNEKDKREYEEKYSECCKAERLKLQKMKESRDRLYVDIDALQKKCNALNSSDGFSFSPALQMVKTAIPEVEKRIKEFSKVKNELISTNIVFPKYTDIVSLTTILEYFESGRCAELQGSNGAYNLYENEIRQNIIISKLDIVIDKLDQIRQSQYMLYNVVKEIQSNTHVICDKLDVAIEELENINKTNKRIENNTILIKRNTSLIAENTSQIEKNTKAIAYFTERTAQYSKMQNELTNALGFLVAIRS